MFTLFGERGRRHPNLDASKDGPLGIVEQETAAHQTKMQGLIPSRTTGRLRQLWSPGNQSWAPARKIAVRFAPSSPCPF
jgi:hypothetical protein